MKITKNTSLSSIEILVVLTIFAILAALLVPEVQQGTSNSRRQHFKNQMKYIALALHEYQNEHGCLPPAVIKDEQGNPMHSWRATLLPYLKATPVFEDCQLDYRFDEPWNSPHNQQIAEKNHTLFRGDWKLSQSDQTRNSKLVAVIDDSTYWSENQSRQLGIDRILLLEVPELSGLWNEPTDLTLDELIGLTQTDRFAPHGAYVLFDDGSVRWLIREEFNPGFMRHLLQTP
ncbi:DUF1559 domain-containing protein [uncultured Gimesia sp.]|uniref:type II secretion system protein n=1 Tax=uncultured Gimesia sp. TaxID=1678688 RepID=UPI0030D728CC|tara:strand:+ start:271259 stop:271951 length:693 start_codon:yes stop_codon:yes gene_type:complete